MFSFFRECNNSSLVVTTRFLQVFREHGVTETQIPNLLPAISLAAIASPEKLLEALTPKVIEQTSQLFGIRREWLEGVADKIYDLNCCYKVPERLFERLASINADHYSLRILSTHKQLDRHSTEDQRLALILVENIASLGEQEINRYHIFADGWCWNYEPTRIQVKAMARIFHRQFRRPIPIFQVGREVIDKLEVGGLVPHKFVQGSMCPDPCLEDYVLDKGESYVAKEVDELPQVLDYIAAHHLDELARTLLVKPQDQVRESGKDALAEPAPTNPYGKRAKATEEIWGPIEVIAQAWWAEEGESLGIHQAILRIKALPHLKASHYSDSAIRKHIAKFAPNAVSEAGRRSKKSPNMQ